MTALVDNVTPAVHRAHDVVVMCDGLPRQAAGPRFRFDQLNPAVAGGRTYAQSLFAELPYMVGVFVRTELRLTEEAWDSLVLAGGVSQIAGPGEYRIPFTLDVVVPVAERPGRVPDEVCPGCWGTGYEIDSDATMTGTMGRLYVCCCAGTWA
jgi:hypothetical protein